MLTQQIYYLVFIILCTVSSAVSRTITVGAHAEECFSDKVERGTKIGLSYEVVEGGFLDIDLSINGPDGKKIHEEKGETSGKYTFSAHATGVYTYCFSNKMSATHKVVKFNIAIGDASKAEAKHGGTAQ